MTNVYEQHKILFRITEIHAYQLKWVTSSSAVESQQTQEKPVMVDGFSYNLQDRLMKVSYFDFCCPGNKMVSE